MARRPHPPASDAAFVAARRGIRAAVAVCATGFAGVVSEGAVFSAAFAAAVSERGLTASRAAVSAAVGGDGRRRRSAADAVVRRQHHIRRNADRDRNGACGARLGSACRHASAHPARHAARSQEKGSVYDRDRTAETSYLSDEGADRQRQSAEGTAERASGDADRFRTGSSDAAGAVSDFAKERRAACGTSAVAVPARLRRRGGGLLLRGVAAADPGCAGNPAGIRITAEMEDRI